MTTPPRQHAPVGARPTRGAAREVSRCTPRCVSALLGPPGLASLLAFLVGPAVALVLLAGLALPAGAQGPVRARGDNLAVAARADADTGGVRASLRREITFLSATRMARRLPPADSFETQTEWSPWGSLFNLTGAPAIAVGPVQIGGVSAAADDAEVLELARLVDEENKTVRADVLSAAPLSDDYLSRLKAELEKATGQKVVLTVQQDPSLISGVVTKIGDRVIDGSVLARLRGFREQLMTH